MTTLKDLIRRLFRIAPTAVPAPDLSDDYFSLDQFMNRVYGPPETWKRRRPRKPDRRPIDPDAPSMSVRRTEPASDADTPDYARMRSFWIRREAPR